MTRHFFTQCTNTNFGNSLPSDMVVALGLGGFRRGLDKCIGGCQEGQLYRTLRIKGHVALNTSC